MTAYYLPAIESKGSWVASCSMMTRRARLPTSTVCSDSYARTCSTAPNVASLPRICSRADRFVELCEYQESSVGGRSSREKRRSARQCEPPPFMRSAAGATKSNSNWTEWHVSRSCAKNSNANTGRGGKQEVARRRLPHRDRPYARRLGHRARGNFQQRSSASRPGVCFQPPRILEMDAQAMEAQSRAREGFARTNALEALPAEFHRIAQGAGLQPGELGDIYRRSVLSPSVLRGASAHP